MQYFKHFSNASSSLKIQAIIHEHGLVGYARYFLLLELLNEKFDGVSTEIELSFKEISTKLQIRLNSGSKSFNQSSSIVQIFPIVFQDDFKIVLQCAILLELMDSQSKYNIKKVNALYSPNTLRSRIKNKDIELDVDNIESKDSISSEHFASKDSDVSQKKKRKQMAKDLGVVLELSHHDFLVDFFKSVAHDVQRAWLESYEPDMLDEEFKKMKVWLITNPQKNPKTRIANFVTNWLSRASESQRKKIPSNYQSKAQGIQDRLLAIKNPFSESN